MFKKNYENKIRVLKSELSCLRSENILLLNERRNVDIEREELWGLKADLDLWKHFFDQYVIALGGANSPELATKALEEYRRVRGLDKREE